MDLNPDLYQLFHSSQTDHFQLNFVGYRNPKADDLMIRIRQEYDEARQTAMARELHRLIAQDQPYTFLYVRRVLALMDGKIVRAVPGPDGQPRYLPFQVNRLGSVGFDFNRWLKTPAPVLPPHRSELGAT
jgi:ABC-type transport system substrate-binding protein